MEIGGRGARNGGAHEMEMRNVEGREEGGTEKKDEEEDC